MSKKFKILLLWLFLSFILTFVLSVLDGIFNVLTLIIFEIILLPAIWGFITYYSRRAFPIVNTYGLVTDMEQKVLNYMMTYGYKVRVSDCARELRIGIEDVKNAMESLEEKGLCRRRES